MARVTIDLPDQFLFTTEIPVMTCHINSGGHVGNDLLIGMLNDVRMQFFATTGFMETGYTYLVADLQAAFRSESFYGEVLRFEVAVAERHKYGADLVYAVTEVKSGREVARMQTSVLVIDPQTGKLSAPPERFVG